MPLYVYNECWFIDSVSSKTVKMVVYLFIHHTDYDNQCIVLQLYKRECLM
jgi:hypothetical protein